MQPISPLLRAVRGATVKSLVAAAALFAVTAPRHAAVAEEKTALPILSACRPDTAPVLPDRWRAVGLMLPLLRQQLDVGEFVYDASIPAMRATIYGMESGAIDLLITDQQTYALSGPRDAPESCTALGHQYTPPATHWLAKAPVCDGEAPVGNKTVQWWKTADADGRSEWQWYTTDTRVPWRTMFSSRFPQPAVIGDYGITYFPTFTPLAETKLAQLRDFCAAKAKQADAAHSAATSARELMALGPDIGADERAARIRALIPGLSLQACNGLKPSRWPNQYVMTGILSPIPVKYTPLPTMLYYDWEHAGALYAYLYEARTLPPAVEMVSVLTKGVGYGVERLPNGVFACAAKSPGVVRPDWMIVADCECKGVIDHNPQLGPNEVSQIRACPVRGEGLHVNWSWYTTEGRPILFAEPDAVGMGLNIADYDKWLPGESMPQQAFELPLQCTQSEEMGLPPVGNSLPAASTVHCTDCHTTRQ
jgi:hypothetical protein